MVKQQFRNNKAAGAETKDWPLAAPLRMIIGAAMMAVLGACASNPDEPVQQWAANGYLTPGPSSLPELIGVFDLLGDCEAAADGWASRQVVGNPVYAECLPVDQD